MSVALALLLSLAAPSAPPEVAESFAELKTDLPTDKARRATALLRFAASDRPGLADRLRATVEARKHAPRRALALLVEARLHGVANRGAPRARALANAAATLGREGAQERKAHVVRVLEGDAALVRLQRLVDRREKLAPLAPPLSDSDDKLASDVEEALSAWAALDDHRQAASARVTLARLRATQGESARALGELSAVLEGPADRDGAAVRAQAQRARAAPRGRRRSRGGRARQPGRRSRARHQPA